MTEQSAIESPVERWGRATLRRWSMILSGVLALYAGLPWLAPLLHRAGYQRLSQSICTLYRSLCHQLPERSFFIGQEQVCYCHRCTALYTALFLMSVIYSVGRWQRALSHRLLLLCTLPIVIDGVWHMLDDLLPGLALRSTDSAVGSLNFWLRMITGTLFGVGSVLWAYPRIQRELAQV